MTAREALQRLSTFEALRNRPFRWLWLGRLASSATFQMGSVAQGWLVYQLTGSAFALGWVSSGWSIANTLLSPWAGVLCDRVEKRTLLLWMRIAFVLLSLGLALLIASGAIQVWHVALYSLLRGILFAVLMPAQNAYLADLVDRSALMNAVSLNSIGMGLTGIFAASLAGWLIEIAGVQAVFYCIALLYGWDLFTLFKLPMTGHSDPQGRSVWADLREGVRYLGVCPVLIPLLGLVFARGLLAMPYTTFMPVYAEEVMGLDARGLGFLVSAPSVGSLASALVLASMGNFRGKGRILLVGGIVLGIMLVLFAGMQSFAMALVVLVLVGAASNVCMVVNQALLQMTCETAFRGRVMSMYMLTFGLTQLGTMPFGAVADAIGVSWVLGLGGGLFALAVLSVYAFVPMVRRLE
jgi:MFS family permease